MRVIIGVFNNEFPKKARYWDANGLQVSAGEYAIVENLNGYDLVEVIGIGGVSDDKLIYVTGSSQKPKKAVAVISKHIFKCSEAEQERG